jgi:lysophospholipase L1-like esterase
MNVMIDLARENGAQVLLLAFPATKPDLSEYLAALEEIRRERRVPLVTYQGPRFDPVHPTAEGYRRLGGQLVARLAAEGYLPPRTGTIKDHRVRSNDAP